MGELRIYLLNVCAASTFCACVKSLTVEKSTGGKILKLICGLFLALTVVQPFADISINDFTLFTADIQEDARAAVSEGEEYVRISLRDIIKDETEAYILDKAEALGADIEVDVTVSGDYQPIPKSVCIIGNVSPYAKARLENILEEDLGIGKEGQLWIG